MALSELDRCLVASIQDGLPLTARPYADIGAQLGVSETEVIQRLAALQDEGIIRRMGVVVRHHELGYRANAMVVWDVPDDRVDEVGRALGNVGCVSLCYQRPRCLPEWPYNLFSMIHGKDRDAVMANLRTIIAELGLQDIAHEVLFSVRRFKQRGARYAERCPPEQEARISRG